MTHRFICHFALNAPVLMMNLRGRLESFISDVWIWMANNFLKLNDSKSEFLILRPSRQSAHLSKVPAPLAISRCHLSPAVSARNIGVILDETMSMDKQIRQVCKSAFHQLHNIRSIRKFLDRDAPSDSCSCSGHI